MLAINFEFPHSYKVDEIPELPGTGKFSCPVYNFPRLKQAGRGEQDGVWLMVKPANRNPWIGVFAIGGWGHSTFFTGALATPNPDRLCVVAHGNVYFVDVNDPDRWEALDLPSVSAPLQIKERNLIVFPFFSNLTAYGTNGPVWRSSLLCADDLRVEAITRNTIECSGYDPRVAEREHFDVDLETGELIEG